MFLILSFMCLWLFVTILYRRLSTTKNTPKVSSEGPKGSPTTPRIAQNQCPRRLKSDICWLLKSLKNHCFFNGFCTFDCFRSYVLAIKAPRTPKIWENVSKLTPGVAPGSQKWCPKPENVGHVPPGTSKCHKLMPRGGGNFHSFSQLFWKCSSKDSQKLEFCLDRTAV